MGDIDNLLDAIIEWQMNNNDCQKERYREETNNYIVLELTNEMKVDEATYCKRAKEQEECLKLVTLVLAIT